MEFTALGVLLICLINLSYLLFRVWVERTKLTLHRANLKFWWFSRKPCSKSKANYCLSITNQASSDKSQLFMPLKYFPAEKLKSHPPVCVHKRKNRQMRKPRDTLQFLGTSRLSSAPAAACWRVFCFPTAIEADLNKSNWTSGVRTYDHLLYRWRQKKSLPFIQAEAAHTLWAGRSPFFGGSRAEGISHRAQTPARTSAFPAKAEVSLPLW